MIRVHTNDTPVVSILSFIAVTFLFANVLVPAVIRPRNHNTATWGRFVRDDT